MQVRSICNFVGKQLKSIHFKDVCNGDDTTSGWNLCSNVQKVIIYNTRLDGTHALLRTPQFSLKSIELNFLLSTAASLPGALKAIGSCIE